MSLKNKKIKFILGILRLIGFNAMKGCNTVFHLALIGIPYSYRSPLAYIKTNLEGTYNILKLQKI